MTLPAPPEFWADEFTALAQQVGLAETTLEAAHATLRTAWEAIVGSG
jgi:hypothetical protein